MNYPVHLVNALPSSEGSDVVEYVKNLCYFCDVGDYILYLESWRDRNYEICKMPKIDLANSWTTLYNCLCGELLVIFCRNGATWLNCPHDWVFERYTSIYLVHSAFKTFCVFNPVKHGAKCLTHERPFSECHSYYVRSDLDYTKADALLNRRKYE